MRRAGPRFLTRAICGAHVASPAIEGTSSAAFLDGVFAAARSASARVLFPESSCARVLAAAAQLAARGLARPLLLGSPSAVAAAAAAAGVDVSGCGVVDPAADAGQLAAWAGVYAAARAHRGVTRASAAAAIAADPHIFAALAIRAGVADGVVSGAASPTAALVRPALELLTRRHGCDDPAHPSHCHRLVSSVFFMCLPTGVVTFADCAVNVAPTASDLATIALDSAATAAAVGATPHPRVALLSYSTHGSGGGEGVERVAAAAAAARAAAPAGVEVDGPLQYDAAVSARVAAAKLGKGVGPVAGRANVLMCVVWEGSERKGKRGGGGRPTPHSAHLTPTPTHPPPRPPFFSHTQLSRPGLRQHRLQSSATSHRRARGGPDPPRTGSPRQRPVPRRHGGRHRGDGGGDGGAGGGGQGGGRGGGVGSVI